MPRVFEFKGRAEAKELGSYASACGTYKYQNLDIRPEGYRAKIVDFCDSTLAAGVTPGLPMDVVFQPLDAPNWPNDMYVVERFRVLDNDKTLLTFSAVDSEGRDIWRFFKHLAACAGVHNLEGNTNALIGKEVRIMVDKPANSKYNRYSFQKLNKGSSHGGNHSGQVGQATPNDVPF